MRWLNTIIGYGLNAIGLRADDTIGGMSQLVIHNEPMIPNELIETLENATRMN